MSLLVSRAALCVCAFGILFSASPSQAQPADPIVGTWRLNLAKSQYPIPPPQRMSITIVPAVSGWTLSVDAVGPDGQPQKWGFTSRFDGSESPVHGNPSVDTAVFRGSAAGGIVEYRKAGQVVWTTSSTISEDGTVMTSTVTIPNPGRDPITIVSVYDRQ